MFVSLLGSADVTLNLVQPINVLVIFCTLAGIVGIAVMPEFSNVLVIFVTEDGIVGAVVSAVHP